MSLLKLLQNSRCRPGSLHVQKTNKIFQTKLSTSTKDEEIIVPKRIPRGPTDILKALASTVKRDPTAAHYKYHDDPYLIPQTNLFKRIYALSQESGRKAAIWIRDENPELFMHRQAEPPIQAFFPRVDYDETDELDNEVLAKIIKAGPLNDAIKVYNIMKNRGDDISEEIKQSLLEKMCFFNETEESSQELLEERWFAQIGREFEPIKKTWKNDGLAEKIFNELPLSVESYSAIIQGTAKYCDVSKAFDYYNLAQANGFVPSPGAHDALIAITFSLNTSIEERWKKIEELLKNMSLNGFKPTLHTLNAVLRSLRNMQYFKDAQKNALKMLAEVKNFGVEPSLASYYYLLQIFCNDKYPGKNIINSVLSDLEGKKLTIQDPYDTYFFSTAMTKCLQYMQDKDTAHRINRLLWEGDNYNFIGNAYRESNYYRSYFMLLCQTEIFDDVMKVYDFLVPHVYIPEVSVMKQLIKTATMNGAVEMYTKLWTDIVTFEMYDKYELLSTLLEGMALNREPISETPSENSIQFSETAWSIYQKVETLPNYKSKIEWTSRALSDALTLFLHANDFTRASEIFRKFIKDDTEIIGVPETETMSLYVDSCIKNEDLKLAMETIAYCANNGYSETKNFARRILKKFTLSPANQTHLVAMVGHDVFKDEEEKIVFNN